MPDDIMITGLGFRRYLDGCNEIKGLRPGPGFLQVGQGSNLSLDVFETRAPEGPGQGSHWAGHGLLNDG